MEKVFLKQNKKPNTKKKHVLKETIIAHSNVDVLSGKAQTEEFYQEPLLFMNEELRNKDNLILTCAICAIN